jgi:ferredoxin
MTKNKKVYVIIFDNKKYRIVPTGSLLFDLRQQGIPLERGCLRGVCGVCRVKIKKGKVTYSHAPSYYLYDNEIVTCIATPQTDLELEST